LLENFIKLFLIIGVVRHFYKYDYEAHDKKLENKALDVIDEYVQ